MLMRNTFIKLKMHKIICDIVQYRILLKEHISKNDSTHINLLGNMVAVRSNRVCKFRQTLLVGK